MKTDLNTDLPRFYDAGEAAIVVEFGTVVDPLINGRVLALDRKLSGLGLIGVRELVPTYRSLMVQYDPLVLPRYALCETIADLVSSLDETELSNPGKLWVLPCCYDPSFGEDLDEVAALTGLARDEVISSHAGAQYRVYMYGFAPAYCYLGGLAERLSIPRRQRPRPPHAAGAVLIGGGLASITTFAMPTGWYVLGRTPVKLYDPRRSDPFLVRPGDSVKFSPISPDEFLDLDARISSGESVALAGNVAGAPQ
ncbi:5-oxoprolinase subunit B family protein [Mesorhizobium sp. ES1-4]|uniref:5-oxoprolinase subunit B family protein n=1 Tax=Mesorhizobium sp. ES1-4 TaxID=2876627 RepID=UPI001CCC5014|nr:allophanate hydrolase subunit 1 [Mesorhizobium sp. ES1-4]MBZ9798432.1 allophanate hydrolase subunit 1 [Mesorhizobium sp. ES1-4]